MEVEQLVEPGLTFTELLDRHSKCERDLPFDAFNRDRRVRDGRRVDCRDCQRARRVAARA